MRNDSINRPLFWVSLVTLALFVPSVAYSLSREAWVSAVVNAAMSFFAFARAVLTWRAMH